MSDPNSRYPLATADGVPVPNETVRPRGFYPIAVSGTASTLLTLTGNYKTLLMVSTVDCIVRFGATASIPSDRTLLSDAIFLPKGIVMTVSPGTMSVSAIAIAGSGSLYVTVIESWAGLGLEYQYGRR
jgi:hypothetical protein